ncbi:unnamed protein product [Candida verbasci]|uniref:60S ribosome subunit biogenesis protein NOP8 n=1 Tax=Candida verbasci TaxID=1227364 RepID=A0A9W4XFJ3_9ASCO|nr:unnamed protein product [Candida verbasci]
MSKIRIHISNISPNLKEKPESLISRIEKLGIKVENELEIHTKPLQYKYFAYLNIFATDSQFENLKKSLNGVMFMGMKLNISKAKKVSYKKRIKEEVEDKEQIIQDKVNKSRLEKIEEYHTTYPANRFTKNIVTTPLQSSIISLSEHTFNNTSGNTKLSIPKKRLSGLNSYGATLDSNFKYTSGKGQVIKGTHRKAPRKGPNLKNQSLRILINGDLIKVDKFYKTKLWGVDQKVNFDDLSYRYSNGEWLSGNNHVVEKCNMSGKQAIEYGANLIHKDEKEIIDDEILDELNKNKSVLASVLNKFDFDKPMKLSDDEEELEEENEENDRAFETVDNPDEIISKSKLELQNPIKEVYYDEDDEGNEIENINENFTTESIIKNYEQEHKEEIKEVEEQSKEDTQSNTENLRSLLNESSNGFKLALSSDDEDIDEFKNIMEEQPINKKQEEKIVETIPINANKFGLFWYHSNSPFLITQSQLSKIGSSEDKIQLPELDNKDSGESGFENWFWSKRSEISRECKIRKRDIIKKFNKRKF